MSDSGKAVFLSYASQDAEAAKKICDALRAAGIEVWFDQSELVGGDAWDQKIRKNIKDCELLIPIISANTQARSEGYFRLEWRLADQRTHLMAKGRPFLLPVVIDGTRDGDAQVPDSFTEVQWTKLPAGETTPAFVARVSKLLSGAQRVRSWEEKDVEEKPRLLPASSRWLRPILAGLVIVIGVLAFTLKQNFDRQAAGKGASSSTPTSASTEVPSAISPARELVAKAYTLIHGLDATREDFALANEYCQRALKLDPDDGEVWAAASQVHSAFGYRGWDTSSERREEVRVTAERAMRLAPRSANARLAQAGAWSTFNINRDEREKLLRDILSEDPGNKEVLRFLAVTVLAKPDGLEEALALNERSAALPGGDALALFNNARYLWQRGRADEAYTALQRALAQQTFTSGLVLKMATEINARGDLAAAEAALRQIPPGALLEDRANYVAGLLRYYQRDGAGALAIWQTFPRDYYSDYAYDGPKGLLVGMACEMDGREAAARLEWRAALQLVDKRIAATPNKAAPYHSRAYLLACLGEKAAATEALQTYEQLAGIKYPSKQAMPLILAQVYARLGRFDEIFATPPGPAAVYRISPYFEGFRADARFERWVAPKKQKTDDRGRETAQPADAKSVAVLAFANLSDDKANEYFADGVSEELLNALAKIPELKVSARTSAFSFKGKNTPVPEIARQLGVAYVVEGSVRRQGDKVRVTAQLIKAADGFRVWSDTFTRDVKDIFAVQDEIAGLVAKNLSLKLRITTPSAAINPEAFRLYLEGRQEWSMRTQESVSKAEELFKQAIVLEPEFARAHAGLADVWMIRGNIKKRSDQDATQEFARASASLTRALEIDPDLAEAYATRANIHALSGNAAEAASAFHRALALNPSYASAHQWYGRLLFESKNFDAGLAELEIAMRLDPLSLIIASNYAMYLGFARRWAESLAIADRALAIRPNGDQAFYVRTKALLGLGRREEALQALRVRGGVPGGDQPEVVADPMWRAVLLASAGDRETALKLAGPVLASAAKDAPSLNVFSLYLALGRFDDAFAYVQKVRPRFHPDGYVYLDPIFDPVRDDSRFLHLIAEAGASEKYQNAWAQYLTWKKRAGEP